MTELAHHAWSVAAIILFALACAGWGAAFVRMVRLPLQGECGIAIACGLAVTVLLGGVVSLFKVMSPAVAISWLMLGLAALAWIGWQQRPSWRTALGVAVSRWRGDRIACSGLLAIIGVVAFFIAGGSGTPFNPYDDMQAYLAQPIKLLDTGTLGIDPFSARRIESAYGGQAFLDALLLMLVEVRQLNCLEHGFGRLVLVLVLFDCARLFQLTPRRALIPAAVSLLIWPYLVNISSVTTSAALMAAMLRCFFLDQSRERILAVTLLGAGLATLKHTNIPVCVLLPLACTLMNEKIVLRQKAVELLSIAAGAAVALIPWMLDMHRSCGTFLFPLLGRGVHGTAQGVYEAANSEMTAASFAPIALHILTSPTLCCGLVLTVVAAFMTRQHPRLRIPIGGVAAAAMTALVMAWLTGGNSNDRYAIAIISASITVLLCACLGPVTLNQPGWHSRCPTYAAWVVATLVAACGMPETKRWIGMYLFRLRSADTTMTDGSQAMRHLQDAIPAGAALLARVARVYQLDFARNDILLIDWPGAAGPAPGLACRGTAADTAEHMAHYLLDQGVRFVAYSYADQAGFSFESHKYALSPAFHDGWDRIEATHTLAFQDQLVELGKTRRHVADDGYAFILDLETASEGK